MVLTGRASLILLFLALFPAKGAQGAAWSEAQISASGCATFRFRNRRWEKVSPSPWRSGMRVQALPVPGRSAQTYVRRPGGGEVQAFDSRCLRLAAPPVAAAPPAPPVAQAPVVSAPSSRSTSYVSSPRLPPFYLSLSYLSWQEELVIDGPAPFSVQANQIGACVGGGWNRALSRRLKVDVGACGLIATSQTAVSTSVGVSSGGGNYQTNDAKVFGLALTPGLLFSPGSETIEFGLSVPLLARLGNWTDPASDFRFQGRLAVLPGVTVDVRFRRGAWFISPKLGFVKATDSIFWTLQLGRGL